MKAVSVSAELTVLQRAVEGAALLVAIERHGGVEDEDSGALISAILELVSVRIRDLGRAVRGTLDAEWLWAQHNAVVEEGAPGADVILRPADGGARKKKR